MTAVTDRNKMARPLSQRPPSQRFVLHVGPHKTATTYVQSNLAMCRPHLSRKGWLYPANVGIQPGIPDAHHDLSYRAETYFWPGRENHRQLTDLAASLDRSGKNLLLSAEGFSMWSLSQYLRLADVLGFARIEVVYALRDPVALMQSYWAEEVKQGMTASLPDRIMMAMLDPMRTRLLNPLIDLNPLIGSDRVTLHLLPFEHLKVAGVDLFTHICDRILGLGALLPKVEGPVNVGFPIEQTEFLRMMSLMHGQGRPDIGPALRMAFIQKTTPTERANWNTTIKQAAAAALQLRLVPADAFFRLAVENRVTDRAAAFCTMPVPAQGIFNRRDVQLVSYEPFLLWNTPTVRRLAQDVLDRLSPSLPALTAAAPDLTSAPPAPQPTAPQPTVPQPAVMQASFSHGA